MHVCERQAGTRSMYIQHSYNSEVSILLLSLLSRASGSLRTTPQGCGREQNDTG